jgi:hypothetical protein
MPAARLAWMVEANTSSPRLAVDMPRCCRRSSAASHSSASTVTLSLLAPACAAPARPVRARHRTPAGAPACSTMASSSLTLPHRPSEHSITRSPGCSSSGPAVSTTGLPGLPRQVNSTLRLKRSPAAPPCAGFPAARCRSGRGCGPAACRRAPGTGANRRNAPSRRRCPAARRPPRWCGACRSALFGGVAQHLVVAGIMMASCRKRSGSASVGLASRWNSAASVCSASCAATSPSGWPPMPSASANRPGVPRVAVAHAVFVLLAAALAADLVDAENFISGLGSAS